MKEQIKKLVELAKDYVIFGKEIKLPNTHNHIRGGHGNIGFHEEGDLINIYFADKRKTWSIGFDKVNVIGYTGTIEMPFDADEEYLKKVHDSARTYLENNLFPNVAKCKLSLLKGKQKKIDDLKKKIAKLEAE